MSLLGAAVPAASNFFLNYTFYRTLAMTPFRLFWPHACVLAGILRWLRLLPRLAALAPRDRARAADAARNLRFSRDVGTMLMPVYVAAMAYSAITPMLAIAALACFLFAYPVWRYQALYIFQPAYRLEGALWPDFAHRVVGCAVLQALFTGVMLLVKGGYVQGIISLWGLIPALLVFDSYLRTRYDRVYASTPVALLEAAPRAELGPELYVPPPLRRRAEGWHPEWGKAWQGWGAPRYGL